jgi:hypothetical protein
VTEDDVRRIVMSMKSCLDPSHIACEKCSPGFNERMEHIDKMRLDQGIRSGCVTNPEAAK